MLQDCQLFEHLSALTYFGTSLSHTGGPSHIGAVAWERAAAQHRVQQHSAGRQQQGQRCFAGSAAQRRCAQHGARTLWVCRPAAREPRGAVESPLQACSERLSSGLCVQACVARDDISYRCLSRGVCGSDGDDVDSMFGGKAGLRCVCCTLHVDRGCASSTGRILSASLPDQSARQWRNLSCSRRWGVSKAIIGG